MSELGKIPGEKGPRPTEDPKRKKDPDSESFREIMKVGKVRETDPDEQGKRKSQAEAEEDFAAQKKGPLLHQGLGSGAPPPPFFSEEGSQPPIGGAAAEPPPNLPASPPPQYTPGVAPAQEPLQRQETQSTTPSQKKAKKKRTEDIPKEATPPPSKKAKTEKGEKKKATKTQPHGLAKESGAKLKTETPQLPGAKEEALAHDLKKKGKEVAQQIEGIDQKLLPPGGWEATKEAEKKEEPIAPSLEVETQSPGTQTGAPPIPTETAPLPLASPFAHLPLQIAQIFERMVGVMTVMNESGITETTLTLDNPQYAKSVFYGAQITISEFSTAPKEFNIELTGSEQALNLMGAGAEELVAAFQAGKYNFKVNRIDLSQQRSTAEIKRKEVQRVKRKKTGGG